MAADRMAPAGARHPLHGDSPDELAAHHDVGVAGLTPRVVDDLAAPSGTRSTYSIHDPAYEAISDALAGDLLRRVLSAARQSTTAAAFMDGLPLIRIINGVAQQLAREPAYLRAAGACSSSDRAALACRTAASGAPDTPARDDGSPEAGDAD